MAAVPTTSIIFCGQLDAMSLGAVSLANSVINVTCLAVGMGLATACDTLFSQSYGSENKTLVGDYLQKSLLILALACLPCWAVHLNTESLLRLLGQDEEIARLAGRYLLLYMPSVAFAFFFMVLAKYMQNQNIVLPSVVIGVATNVVNAGLHYVFVYTLDLRTDGSALAQVSANFTAMTLTLLYIVCSGCCKDTWAGKVAAFTSRRCRRRVIKSNAWRSSHNMASRLRH
ncbi:Multidrug and toxin extrusion protein 1 [Lamellibrachia satsuma]|nr:Multidrug and toxin extrusion protein 1 [Lamellibrachia satsuma]